MTNQSATDQEAQSHFSFHVNIHFSRDDLIDGISAYNEFCTANGTARAREMSRCQIATQCAKGISPADYRQLMQNLSLNPVEATQTFDLESWMSGYTLMSASRSTIHIERGVLAPPHALEALRQHLIFSLESGPLNVAFRDAGAAARLKYGARLRDEALLSPAEPARQQSPALVT